MVSAPEAAETAPGPLTNGAAALEQALAAVTEPRWVSQTRGLDLLLAVVAAGGQSVSSVAQLGPCAVGGPASVAVEEAVSAPMAVGGSPGSADSPSDVSGAPTKTDLPVAVEEEVEKKKK